MIHGSIVTYQTLGKRQSSYSVLSRNRDTSFPFDRSASAMATISAWSVAYRFHPHSISHISARIGVVVSLRDHLSVLYKHAADRHLIFCVGDLRLM